MEKRLAFFEFNLRRLLDAPWQETVRVLEVGCGNGDIARKLAVMDKRLCITGMDIDAESVALARAGAPDNTAFLCQSLWDFAPDQPFHAIIASELLEHFDDPAAVLRRFHQCLLPGGLLLLTVPNGWGAVELSERAWERVKSLPGLRKYVVNPVRGRLLGAGTRAEDARVARLMDTYPHVQTFTMGRLLRLLDSTGYQAVCRGHSSFLKGSFPLNLLLTRSRPLTSLDSRIADRMSPWMVSGWFLAAIKRE